MSEHRSNYDEIIANNPNDPIPLDDDDILSPLIEVIADELDELDVSINHIEEELLINTASDWGLDARGADVGVFRRSGETDDEFRQRIIMAYGRALSDATAEQFGLVLRRALDADSSDIAIRPTEEDVPEMIVDINQSVVDDSPLDEETIVEELNGALPMGHGLRIETSGSFEFDSDDYEPAEGTGFNEGTFGGDIE